MIENNELLEYAVVYGDYKGIPKKHVREALASGQDVIMRIDVQGAAQVKRARTLAKRAGAPVVGLANRHTTVSVERATLRLAGLTGADHEGQPWVNHLVDAVRDQVGLEHGVTTPVYDALRRGVAPDLLTLALQSASDSAAFRLPEGKAADPARRTGRAATANSSSGSRRDASRRRR